MGEAILYSSDPNELGAEYDRVNGWTYGGDEPFDPDWELECFARNAGRELSDMDSFVAVGSVSRWNGRFDGGKVLTNVMGAEDFIGRFTSGYRGNCEITLVDVDGELEVRITDHDGGMSMTVRALTQRGRQYFDNHEYDFSDREMCEHLFNTRGLSKKCHLAEIVYGTGRGR